MKVSYNEITNHDIDNQLVPQHCIIPVTPPIVKEGINATAYNIGTVNFTLPPHIVNSQLKILIPVGTAIAIVATAKIAFAIGPSLL